MTDKPAEPANFCTDCTYSTRDGSYLMCAHIRKRTGEPNLCEIIRNEIGDHCPAFVAIPPSPIRPHPPLPRRTIWQRLRGK